MYCGADGSDFRHQVEGLEGARYGAIEDQLTDWLLPWFRLRNRFEDSTYYIFTSLADFKQLYLDSEVAVPAPFLQLDLVHD